MTNQARVAARRDRGTDRLSRLDRHDHRDRRYRCAAGRGRHERAACTVRAAAVSVRRRRTMTNQARVAADANIAKEARRVLLQTARRRNNQKP